MRARMSRTPHRTMSVFPKLQQQRVGRASARRRRHLCPLSLPLHQLRHIRLPHHLLLQCRQGRLIQRQLPLRLPKGIRRPVLTLHHSAHMLRPRTRGTISLHHLYTGCLCRMGLWFPFNSNSIINKGSNKLRCPAVTAQARNFHHSMSSRTSSRQAFRTRTCLLFVNKLFISFCFLSSDSSSPTI
jgi:hypothetical protein